MTPAPSAHPGAAPGRASVVHHPHHRPRRGFLYSPIGVWSVRAVTFVVLIGAWELYASGVSRALFAPPSAILESIMELAAVGGPLWGALAVSLGALLVGFGLAIVVGVAIGLLMGRFRPLEYVLDPYVSFLYALPSIALIPLLVIWFGIDAQLRLALVFLAGVFPVIINTMAGVKNVDPELLDVGRVAQASERQMMWTIVLPASLPFIFAGVRVALSQALVGVIVAEMTAIITGLGGMIIRFANFFQTAHLFVPILAIMVVSVALTELMKRLERRLTPWDRNRIEEAA
ncbi:MAG TPA: ABC transporter permease [Candidatus Limnocylindria bacterium]|nr:ABC transporter permease [Candidatus Limnocylindria bacterium]